MKYNNFEDYLRTIHMKDNPKLLDDDLPDAFEDWIVEQNIDDVIRWADEYVEEISF